MRIKYLIVICLVILSPSLYGQVIDSVDMNGGDSVVLEIVEDQEEYQPSEEEKEIIPESEEAKSLVKSSEELLSYINLLRDKDSLIYRFVIFLDQEEINLVSEGESTSLPISKKFDIIFYPNTKNIMYVREMILNENQAWDYIYERVFDEKGQTKIFVRQYSTFNSFCAEVAFERSEYYFDDKSEIIKKTYEIFDEQHSPLNIQECWMEREVYLMEKSLNEIKLKYNFPLDNIEIPSNEIRKRNFEGGEN